MRKYTLPLFSLVLTALVPADTPPAEALKTMSVPKGLVVQLFAAEPLVSNPTNLDVDERGRVWVTESGNYDASPEEFDAKGDKIVILEDTNGDGRADKRKVFYEHPSLNAPMGLALAPGRVYLAQSPNLLVLHDEDGDDRADRIDTLFTGLGRRDHGVHAPLWGPDGKLYFSMGNYGKEVRDRRGKLVVDRAGNPVQQLGQPYRNGLIFRCNPDGTGFETLAHNFRNQIEPALDSFGNLWVTDNDDDGNQSCRVNFVLEFGNYGFADERTGEAWTAYRTNLEATVPERHWHQADPGVVPNVLITGAGSPAGLLVYEGALLPPAYRRQPLHAEALHHVTRSYSTKKEGAGYTATILDLLKSTDPWHRPVDVSVAPDGSVLVADWYDPGIGGGTAADARKGRIYRVAAASSPPQGFKTLAGGVPYRIPRPDVGTPAMAALSLKSPNAALRRRAWERLHAWQGATEPVLNQLVASGDAVLKARAFWLLTKIRGREDVYLKKALADPNPDIRVMGLRAVRQTEGAELLNYLRLLAYDPAPEVRRECAIALRFLDSPEANELWATLARQHDGTDRWYLEALGIGADLHADARFATWLKSVGAEWNTPGGRDLVWRMRAAAALPKLAALIRAAPDEAGTLRYFRAFDFHPNGSKNDGLLGLLDDPRPGVVRLALQHSDAANLPRTAHLAQALDRALANGSPEDFVKLSEKFGLKEKREALLALVCRNPDRQVGTDAAQLLWAWGEKRFLENSLRDDSTAIAWLTAVRSNGAPDLLAFKRTLLLDGTRSPEVRKTAVRSLGGSWSGEEALLAVVKANDFPESLKPTAASVLFGAFRNKIKREAEAYLPRPKGRDGQALPPVYLLMYEKGDAAKGQAIFARNCTVCHRAGETGVLFGPELSKIGAKLSKEGLFRALLYPDEGINPGYETYVLKTADGGTLTGLLASESAGETVLKLPGGTTQAVKNSAIVSKTKAEHSMMPAFGESLSQAELVDLVAYLEGLK
jgi:putative membrane-bound dehydrogenase-like protein